MARKKILLKDGKAYFVEGESAAVSDGKETPKEKTKKTDRPVTAAEVKRIVAEALNSERNSVGNAVMEQLKTIENQ